MTICQLADTTGASKHTLRYYERMGLVPLVQPDASSGHRRYSAGHEPPEGTRPDNLTPGSLCSHRLKQATTYRRSDADTRSPAVGFISTAPVPAGRSLYSSPGAACSASATSTSTPGGGAHHQRDLRPAGTGWSDQIPLPRSAAEVAEELRSLLRTADLAGPYLLVGHSLGGLYARRFAQLFPGDVAGLLLLDPAHEDYPANEPEVARRAAEEWKNKPMPELGPEQIEGFRPILKAMYAEWPPDILEPLIERHLDRVTTGILEASNVDQLYDEMRQGSPIPPVPVIVYTAMGIDASQMVFSTEEVVRAQNAAKLATNTAFARSVPGVESRVLEDASHAMIHTRRPDAVMQGVRDLLARIGR